MYLHTNIKFLRNYLHLTQAEFGKLFELTRANIESYERGIAKPKQDKQISIANHFNLSVEVLSQKDLTLNPGLLYAGASVTTQKETASADVIKMKDEMIKELKARVKYLEDQNSILLKKLKVA